MAFAPWLLIYRYGLRRVYTDAGSFPARADYYDLDIVADL
jgi:hypothetical protein